MSAHRLRPTQRHLAAAGACPDGQSDALARGRLLGDVGCRRGAGAPREKGEPGDLCLRGGCGSGHPNGGQ
eukprot:7560102-Alexandrium_andersonii.AAC.1